MKKIVLLRHGESAWNKENRFTGWTDVGLTPKGVEEAVAAGRTLTKEGYAFDTAFTSVLSRAIKTLWLALEEMDRMWIPVHLSWRLNERHYGALQGLNKAETAERHGMDQVLIWRRSYDTRPPALTPDDPRYPGSDPRYAGLGPQELPLTECLKDTVARFLPYWHEAIAPAVKSRAARHHRRPRQQPAGAGQVPRPRDRQGHSRTQHPHRHPAGLRAAGGPHPDPQLLPRGPRGSAESRSGRGRPAEKVKILSAGDLTCGRCL